MRIPTVKVKNTKTGETMIVNEADFAEGTLTSDGQNSADGWERVGEETTGEQNETLKAAADEAHQENQTSLKSAAAQAPLVEGDAAAKKAATAGVKDKVEK